MRPLAIATLLIACVALPFEAISAERRVALVIGNGAYQHTERLPNPKNDAEDVSAALQRTGFETIVGLDLDRAGMEAATIRFARAAREADVAIFYYSGHALQFNGINYLMPVDASLADETDLRRMARVDEIVADVQQAKNLRILVLDSCRDNPLAEQLKRRIGLTRSAGLARGLAKIDSPQGMILAFSTQAGATAADGTGRNSPYTSAFLKHIEASEEIGTVFRRVSADVFETTKRSQLPELSLSLIGEFYLKGRPVAVPQPAPDVAALQERLKALEEQLKNKNEPKIANIVPPVAPSTPNESQPEPPLGVPPLPTLPGDERPKPIDRNNLAVVAPPQQPLPEEKPATDFAIARQEFNTTCSVCHSSTQGLAKNKNEKALVAFLREHYTSSSDKAAVMAKWLKSAGSSQGSSKGR